MGDTDKPFPCKHPGCSMTFSNEDHLNVHSKKHDMVLNLGLSKANAIADQTPTPTRFIRNCEEVGLFQDLQNVNPFEETFRKAVENGKTGTLHVPEANSEDTLHTPQIFHTEEKKNDAKYDEEMPTDFSMSLSGTLKVECKSESNSPIKPIYTSVIYSSKSEIDASSSNSNDNSMMIDDVSTSSQEFTTETACKPTVLREKLKEVLEKRRSEEDPLDIKEADRAPARKRLDLKSKFTLLPTKPKKVNNDINIYDKNVSEVDKRRMMNRMAQMRSRERKKLWIDHMEEEIAKLRAENRMLVAENQRLKEENVNIKVALLKHSNCSLTIDLQRQASKSNEVKPGQPAILEAPSMKPGPQIITVMQVPVIDKAVAEKAAPKKELPRLLPKPITSSVTTTVINSPPTRQNSMMPKPIMPASPPSLSITVNGGTLNIPPTVELEVKSPYSNKVKKK